MGLNWEIAHSAVSVGIDALVTSVLEAGIKPNSNVYAELGSTWRFLSMRDPTHRCHRQPWRGVRGVVR